MEEKNNKIMEKKKNPDKIMNFFPFFYGYIVIIIGSIGKIMSSPGQSICIGVVIASMNKDIQITSTQSSVLYFLGTTLSALTLPFTGKYAKKLGQQIYAAIAAIGLGIACFFFSNCETQFEIFIGFYLLRFFGQGNIMTVSVVEINLWWVQNRGKMVGLASSISAWFMIGILPIIMNYSSQKSSWRDTYFYLGLAEILFMLPLGIIFFREAPEYYGLLPDGKQNPEQQQSIKEESIKLSEKLLNYPQKQDLQKDDIELQEINSQLNNSQKQNNTNLEENFTVKDMLKTGAFWSICPSISTMALTGTAFIFHLRPLFESQGISSSTVDYIYICLSFTAIIFPLLTGYLIDQIQPKYVLLLALASNIVGQFCMIFIGQDTHILIFLSVLMMGMQQGMMQIIYTTIMATYYGRENLSLIQPIMQSAMIFGSAIGPLPYSMAKDYLGGYQTAFLFGTILPIINFISVYYKGNKPQLSNYSNKEQ